MALALTTTFVIEPPVDDAVILNNTGVPTCTGFGEAEAAVMLIVVDNGVKTATARLFFWVPFHVAVKVSEPALNS